MKDALDIWLDGAPVVLFDVPGDFATWMDGTADVDQGQVPVRRRATVSLIE